MSLALVTESKWNLFCLLLNRARIISLLSECPIGPLTIAGDNRRMFAFYAGRGYTVQTIKVGGEANLLSREDSVFDAVSACSALAQCARPGLRG